MILQPTTMYNPATSLGVKNMSESGRFTLWFRRAARMWPYVFIALSVFGLMYRAMTSR
jgi:hypothetical protein